MNVSESDATASPQVQLNSARSRERLSIPDQANTPPRNTPSPAQRTSPRPESQTTTTSSQEEEEASEHSPTSPQPPRPVVTPNQFVEPELLYGACKCPRSVIKPLLFLPCSIIAFGNHLPPVENVEYQGGLPNVLALPYGKGQPMHIRASSWRQLLKLLAKLSATQIEPTVEARAATKGALLLQTVIQFFRVCRFHASPEGHSDLLASSIRPQQTGGRSFTSPLTTRLRLTIGIRTESLIHSRIRTVYQLCLPCSATVQTHHYRNTTPSRRHRGHHCPNYRYRCPTWRCIWRRL